MAKKGPLIAAGAITGVLFFWRKKRKKRAAGDRTESAESVPDEISAEA